MVLDLDNTLISASTQLLDSEHSKDQSYVSEEIQKEKNFKSFIAENYKIEMVIRNGVAAFLQKMNQFYELWIFSNGIKSYVFKIANILEEYTPSNQKFFEGRILSRGDTLFKDIRRISSFKPNETIILDDSYIFWSKAIEATQTDINKRFKQFFDPEKIFIPAFLQSRYYDRFEEAERKMNRILGRYGQTSKCFDRFLIDLDLDSGFEEKFQLEKISKVLEEIAKRFRKYKLMFPHRPKKYSVENVLNEIRAEQIKFESFCFKLKDFQDKKTLCEFLKELGAEEVELGEAEVVFWDEVEEIGNDELQNLKTEKRIFRVEYVFKLFFEIYIKEISHYQIKNN